MSPTGTRRTSRCLPAPAGSYRAPPRHGAAPRRDRRRTALDRRPRRRPRVRARRDDRHAPLLGARRRGCAPRRGLELGIAVTVSHDAGTATAMYASSASSSATARASRASVAVFTAWRSSSTRRLSPCSAARDEGRLEAERVPGRPERYGPRRMAVRGGRGAGLRRDALGRPGLVATPPRALPRRRVGGDGAAARTRRLALPRARYDGARGGRRGRPPAGRVPPLARRPPARARRCAVARPLHLPAREPAALVNFGGWPLRAPVLAARSGCSARFSPGTCFVLLLYRAAGDVRGLWLRELGLPVGAALVGGLVFALEPYRVAQSVGHLRGPISVLLPLRSGPSSASRSGSACGSRRRGRARSIPFSDVHLALGAIPSSRSTRSSARAAPAPLGRRCSRRRRPRSRLLVRESTTSGIDRRARTLAGRAVRIYSATGLDFARPLPAARQRALRLPRLGDAAARARRARRAAGRAPRRLAAVLAVGAVVPMLLALGTHFAALLDALARTSRRCATRGCPNG